MYLILERAGTFKASTMISTTSKCGAMAMNTYNYRVRIQATSQVLTPQGYVINNEEIQNFFDERFGEKAKPWMACSCENMAQQSCKELTAILRMRKIRLKLIRVTLEGSNGALITAEWKASLLDPILSILKPLKNPLAIEKWQPQESWGNKNDSEGNEGGQ
jgi:hypothetical protein